MSITKNLTGLSQNELIQELAKNVLTDMPVRIIQVDETRPTNLRIEGVEVVGGEVHIIIDNFKK